ncbi:MAG: hypothetical protein ACK5P2_00665 [Pseudanabaena sp.]
MSKLNRKQIRKNSFLAPAVITATVAASTLLSSSANFIQDRKVQTQDGDQDLRRL